MSTKGSKTTKKKPCKNCKKNKKLDLGVDVPQEDYTVSLEDIKTAYGYLNEMKVVRGDEQKMSFLKKIYKEVTGYALDEKKCISCHMSSIIRRFRNFANQDYNTNFR
jgi:hypothetical protein